MPTPAAIPESKMSLRHQAEALLLGGSTPRTQVAATGVEFLALLHGMAADPEKASDVLKLLHELQVYQVELDLQNQQLEESRDELSHALDRYVGRYDFAPVGYFAVGRDGRIIEGNLAAADFCGVAQEALGGRPIDSVVTPQSRSALLALMRRLCKGDSRETCEVQIGQGAGAPRQFQVVATVSPDDRSLMMIFVETTDRRTPGLST